MVPKNSKEIVVDASIAQACGGPTSSSPVAKSCREALGTILGACHRIVMTEDLVSEWKSHKSRHFTRWLTQMFGRKKVRYSRASAKVLQDKIHQVAQTTSAELAMLKDISLIDAALAADKIVISLDDTAREHFSNASIAIPELRGIVWVNPAQPSEDATNWLIDGAKPHVYRSLGHRPGKPQERR